MSALGACRVFVVAGILVGCWTADASAQQCNLPICAAGQSQTTPSMDADGSGGAVFAWADRRNGTDYDIYVQRVDALDNVLWTSQGVAVCTAGGNQTEPMVLSDGAGGAFITWTDGRSANTDIYAQRVNAAGVPQWTPNGVGVCVGGNAQHLPVEASDGAGGVIICWNDQTSGTSLGIFAQRLDGSGAAIWTSNGVQVSPIASAGTSVPKIIADGSGGAVVVWAYNFPEDLNAQRINSAGVPQWGTNGIVVSNATNGQNGPSLYPDGTGGAFIVWNDFRNTSSGEDVYGQRVNGTGTPQWTANGMPIAVAGDLQALPVLTTDGAGGVLVAWQDRRNPGSQDIYGQRLNAAGTAQWTANGQSLCGGGSVSRYVLSIASDGAGGAVVAWDQATGSFDIYAERVNSSGADVWSSAGVAVSTATGAQRFPLVAAAGAGASIVCWTDSRPGSSQTDIYAQRLRADGTLPGPVNTFTITSSAGANGSISPSGAVSACGGGNQTFLITPNSCYSVANVLVDGSSVGAVTSYTFTNIQANHTISASFAPTTYTITTGQSTQGQISPSGNVGVSCGADREFDIIPYAPYFLADVLIDGNSVGAVSTYTFLNVQSNHTIQPVFSTVLVYGDPNAFTVHPNLISTTCYATPESCLVTIVGSAGAITMNNSVVPPARVIAENPSRDFEEVFVDSSAVAPSLIQLMQTSARMAQMETTFVGPAGGVIDFTHPTKMRFRPTYSTSPDDSLIVAQVVDQQDASPLGLVFYKVESDSAYFVNIISPDSTAFFTHDSLIAVVSQDSTKVRVTFVCGPRDTAGLSVSGGASDRADPARFGKFKKQFAKLTGKVEKFFEKTKMCIRREEPFCCAGTLGSLVTDGTNQYILSNNHVLARHNNEGVAGEPIEQPGTLDVNCSPSASEYVANLTRFLPLDFAPTGSNVVDCAIAQVIPGKVDPSGAILDIGQISDQIISSPSIGLSVKKSGRTTGLTTGTVTGLNVNTPITYDVRCGSDQRVTANFVKQVMFSKMSDEGDSGSLIVEDVAGCPRPVALLFASSPSATFGNPIDSVLVRLGVSFVHGSCPAPSRSTRATESDVGLSHAMDVQNTNTARLLQVPGVAGTAVGKDESGRWVIQILVERDTPELRAQLPTSLGDFPTRLVETGVIEAY